MKKNIVILSIIALLLLLIIYGLYYFFFSLRALPESEFICESISPHGTYIIKAYVSSPALSSSAVWCELLTNKSKPKVIYLGYREGRAEIVWEDDSTVAINGKRLVLPKDTYDFRRHN